MTFMALVAEPLFQGFVLLLSLLASVGVIVAAPESKGTLTGVALFFLILYLGAWRLTGQ